MMFLSIDTTTKIGLCLYDENKHRIYSFDGQNTHHQTEDLLSEIGKFLKESKVAWSDIYAIIINPGPGSYTGTRIGVTTANFLAFGLNIGVFKDISGATFSKFMGSVLPVYTMPPKITQRKS